jgi:hypothetical protein
MTPTSSVDADHASDADVLPTDVVCRFVGLVGACVSSTAGTVTDMVGLGPLSTPTVVAVTR